MPMASASAHCRSWVRVTPCPVRPVTDEANPKDVTPPPPTGRPLASRPRGAPMMPVYRGVDCTGASCANPVPGSWTNIAMLQMRKGRAA